jgi:CRP/FNR family transcriptional regulator, cyclic AMP receptor protein
MRRGTTRDADHVDFLTANMQGSSVEQRASPDRPQIRQRSCHTVGSQPMTFPESLQHSDFLRGIPEPLRPALEALARPRHFPAGQVLFTEGSPQDDLHLIAAGHVRLDMVVPGLGRRALLSLGPGDLLAWSALLGNQVMTTSALALEPVDTVALSGPKLQELCEAQPEIGYHLMQQVARALSRRLVATRLQLLDLFRHDSPALDRPVPEALPADEEC